MEIPPSIAQLIERVPRLAHLCPQQITSDESELAERTRAALVDQWGRAHSLWPVSIVGREMAVSDLTVLEACVSRRHAEFKLDEASGRWTVTDLGSTNGTFVEGKRLGQPAQLDQGMRVVFGEVGFVFTERHDSLFDARVRDSIKRTLKAAGSSQSELILLGAAPGGGGIVEYREQYVQLGPTQYALMCLFAQRWLRDTQTDPQLRGFVRSIDLITELPWDTPHPEDNNVKQLVRRLRRAFGRVGLESSVESRRGFGYRLALPVRIQSE